MFFGFFDLFGLIQVKNQKNIQVFWFLGFFWSVGTIQGIWDWCRLQIVATDQKNQKNKKEHCFFLFF